MASTGDDHRFVLIRSDRLSFEVLTADEPKTVGRSRTLPSSQQLSSKYVSREQFTLTWHPPSLFVEQRGKNPTFYGADSRALPAASSSRRVEFRPAAAGSGATAPSLATAADGHDIVTVPLCDPVHARDPPPLTQRDAATLFFPDGLGLPSFVVRCQAVTSARAAESREEASAATSKLTAAQMLAVPAMGVSNTANEDDEEDEVGRGPSKTGEPGQGPQLGAAEAENGVAAPIGVRAEWNGLLDMALQQKHQQELARQEQQTQHQQECNSHDAKTESPRVPDAVPRSAAPAAVQAVKSVPQPSAPSATHAGVKSSDPSPGTTVRPPAPAVPPPSMGFWEWKCHANGPDHDRKSWRKYPLAVAKLLEEAFQAKKMVVKIPDDLLQAGGHKRQRHGEDEQAAANDAASEGASAYSVCFAEESLDGGMIQFQNDDPGKFRVVRRVGGADIERRGLKPIRVIPVASSSSSSSSSDDGSTSESSFSESESESVHSSSSSSSRSKKAKRHTRRPKRGPHGHK